MIVEVLGNVQDGGTPHLGCECDFCSSERESPTTRGMICSLMVRDAEKNYRYLIEASPDIRLQIGSSTVDGVFVPHARLGTLGGIEFFGKQGVDTEHLAVYCNEDVKHYLMNNDPYRKMVDRGNIKLEDFQDGDEEDLVSGTIGCVELEHLQLGYNTTAYRIEGEEKTLFYLTDINQWTARTDREIENADIAVIDGTFWSEDEIDRFDEVPHPTVQESMDRFEDTDTEIYFTHLNHTNPILRKDTDERQEVEDRGFGVAEAGMEFEL